MSLSDPITRFRGQYSWLSNFYPVNIKYKGVEYKSAEHAYQSQRNHQGVWKTFCASDVSPVDIKRMSHKIGATPDWGTRKLQVMEEILRIKFSKVLLTSLLLNTGDREILEGNTWGDTFWGVDAVTLVGDNHLGKLIMKIREEHRLALIEENQPT